MASPALVVVTSSFPIGGDGSEAAGSFVVDLVEELAKHIEVRVVAPGRGNARERWSESVVVHRYAAPSRPLSTLKPWRPNDVGWIARVLQGGLQATRAAAGDGATHFLALWGLPCGEWVRRVARETDTEYSVWLLGSDVWSLGRVPVLHGLLAGVIKQARHAYADGYKLGEDARRIGKRPIEFLPSTRKIELTDVPPSRTEPPYRLLFLGRWHPNKGIDLLLDALELLDDADWQRISAVDILGGGPMEPLVRAKVRTLSAAGRPVQAGGFVSKPEAERAIVRADRVIIPSRIESIPVVFSDAVKLGRPVVATPVGDLLRLVSEGCGLVCDSTSPQAIAATLQRAIRDTVVRAESLAEVAERFSIREVALRVVRGAAIG